MKTRNNGIHEKSRRVEKNIDTKNVTEKIGNISCIKILVQNNGANKNSAYSNRPT